MSWAHKFEWLNFVWWHLIFFPHTYKSTSSYAPDRRRQIRGSWSLQLTWNLLPFWCQERRDGFQIWLDCRIMATGWHLVLLSAHRGTACAFGGRFPSILYQAQHSPLLSLRCLSSQTYVNSFSLSLEYCTTDRTLTSSSPTSLDPTDLG